MKRKIYYHFTSETLRDGIPIPPIGKWLRHDGPLKMCKAGLHASPTAWDALQYAPGEFLHKVRLRGEMIDDTDKSVAMGRCIIASIDATDVLLRFARTVALKVIHLWEAPPIVREYLESGDESKRDAARNAAWDAAWNAARNAAWDAAWNAARDAAWNAARPDAREAAREAARAASRAAVWDASRDVAWAEYKVIFNEMVEKEFKKVTHR